MIATLRGEAQGKLRDAWRLYRRVPRPVRWPLTLITLTLLAVILANLTFGASQRTSTTTVLIPAGQTIATTVQVDAGSLGSVRWSVQGAGLLTVSPEGGPLTVQLTGPSEELPLQERALSGRFDFKNGFTRSSYQLQLGNDGSATNGSTDSLRVEVRWITR